MVRAAAMETLKIPQKDAGYQQIYQGLEKQLATHNFTGAAARLGMAEGPDGSLVCSFLGRSYHISQNGVHPADGGAAHPNVRSVLAYYAMSSADCAADWCFAPLSARHEGMVSAGLDELGWAHRPLKELADADFDTFAAALAAVGAEYGGVQKSAHLWTLRALPKIPVRVVYEPADEEFGSSVKILFDTAAYRFMEFEKLAFMDGCIVSGIMGQARGNN